MGTVNFKKKKVHFTQISNFSVCICKYFKPLIKRVLAAKDEGYGGFKAVLEQFQKRIAQELDKVPELGLNSGQKRGEI